MTQDKALEKLARLKEEIEHDKQRQQLFTYVGGGVVLVFTVLLLMIVTGDPLGLLRIVGLSDHKRTGAYGDCSIPENKNAPFCKPNRGNTKLFESMRRTKGKGSQFTLH